VEYQPALDGYVWVVRKGATPAFPGQRGFIGGSMGDFSAIVEGLNGVESVEALYSTVHGAGRVMSRTKASGKKKWRKGRVEHVSEGLISRKMMDDWLTGFGVTLRGAGTDESPHVYRRLPDVLDAHKNTIDVIRWLKPIGVAMAGDNEYDPFKD
jgi:tRNA-splicing ligase RtcB